MTSLDLLIFNGFQEESTKKMGQRPIDSHGFKESKPRRWVFLKRSDFFETKRSDFLRDILYYFVAIIDDRKLGVRFNRNQVNIH